MAKRKTTRRLTAPALPARRSTSLLADVREMILQTRAGVARAVDAGLTMLYWHVGRRIRQDVLKEQRAEYGEQVVETLGHHLEAEFGRGFGKRNLFRMIRFAEVFPDPKIVSALGTQLGWTHFRQIALLELHKSGIHVAKLLDEVTPKEGPRTQTPRGSAVGTGTAGGGTPG